MAQAGLLAPATHPAVQSPASVVTWIDEWAGTGPRLNRDRYYPDIRERYKSRSTVVLDRPRSQTALLSMWLPIVAYACSPKSRRFGRRVSLYSTALWDPRSI